MTRKIFCQKLQQEAHGLTHPPYPGELGDEIYDHISAQAWQLWLEHQTMLINENRLILSDPIVREYLRNEMVKFLFQGGADKPAGYVPPS